MIEGTAAKFGRVPVNFAHPAAMLPLRRLGLPAAALVAGSMAPDAPVFASEWGWYAVTHSWLGILVIDPLIAVAALAAWSFVARDAVADLMPDPVRLRLAPSARPSKRALALAVPAALTLATPDLRDPYHPRVVAFVAVTHGTLWTVAALAGLTLWWRMLAFAGPDSRA